MTGDLDRRRKTSKGPFGTMIGIGVCVARSSAVVEYRAMANGICELVWLQRVLGELQRPMSTPMKL